MLKFRRSACKEMTWQSHDLRMHSSGNAVRLSWSQWHVDTTSVSAWAFDMLPNHAWKGERIKKCAIFVVFCILGVETLNQCMKFQEENAQCTANCHYLRCAWPRPNWMFTKKTVLKWAWKQQTIVGRGECVWFDKLEKRVVQNGRKIERVISESAKECQNKTDLCCWDAKRTTPGIPTWSPTVVLTRPEDA